jgi:hypothetical protein
MSLADLLSAAAAGGGGGGAGVLQVPREGFYTASMSGVVSSQLGPFGHKPEVLSEMLAGK